MGASRLRVNKRTSEDRVTNKKLEEVEKIGPLRYARTNCVSCLACRATAYVRSYAKHERQIVICSFLITQNAADFW